MILDDNEHVNVDYTEDEILLQVANVVNYVSVLEQQNKDMSFEEKVSKICENFKDFAKDRYSMIKILAQPENRERNVEIIVKMISMSLQIKNDHSKYQNVTNQVKMELMDKFKKNAS